MNAQEFRDLGLTEDSKDFTVVIKKRGESKKLMIFTKPNGYTQEMK